MFAITPAVEVEIGNASVNDPLLLSVLFVFLVATIVVAILFLARIFFLSRKVVRSDFDKVIFLVTLPKEASDAADQQESADEIKNQIGLSENLFATIGGLRAKRGLRSWLLGRDDHFSLEVVYQKGLISFYVAAPARLASYLEQQIVAQYPEASLMQVEDYNIFSDEGEMAGGMLRFTRTYIFPIKTYQEFNSDPLNAIAGSLSRIDPKDGVAIQIVLRSAKKKWHRQGMAAARLIQKGKTPQQAVSESKLFSMRRLLSFITVKSPEQLKSEQDMQSKGLSPMDQETVKGIEKKTSKAGMDCNIRIITFAKTKFTAEQYLSSIVDSFSQYNFYQYGNSFKLVKVSNKLLANDFIYRKFRENHNVLLNTEELASLYHFPTPFLDTPNIRWMLAKQLPPPSNLPQEGLLIGQSLYRGVRTNVYLQTEDRRRHWYIIGMTGTGKSVLMSNAAIQDIRAGKGVCVIDPHGSLVEDILPAIPAERLNDVIYFNPSDTAFPIGLNMLEAENDEQQDFVIQEMISIFYKLVTDPSMIGPMFEHNMRNAMLTLMADKKDPGTIAEIPRMFTDKDFQQYKLKFVTDPMVRSFWEQEMAKTSDFHKSEMLGYLISKVGRFVENAMVRNIIGQPRSGFNFRKVMDEKKILLVNLAKGTTGEVNSNLIGLIIVAKLQMAALSRTDIPEEQRSDFYLYIDEFQNFITDSVSTILAEARKYKLNLTLAHQYIGQLTQGSGVEGKSYGDKIKDSIFGNVGTLTSFRIGVEDSEIIAKQMAPVVDEYDLMNIERYNAYVRLLVNNQPYKAFNMQTFPPIKGDAAIVAKIKEFSRATYGKPRAEVEQDVLHRSQLGVKKAAKFEPPLERAL